MRGPFAAKRGGRVVAVFTDVEVAALRQVAAEMLEALGTDQTHDLRRLFPPAYADDPVRDEEFRAMTRDDLLEHKREAARTVLTTLGGFERKRGGQRFELTREEAEKWLGFINDARLVLGTKINVTEDMDHDPLPESDPAAPAHNMYIYLSALCGYLVDALME